MGWLNWSWAGLVLLIPFADASAEARESVFGRWLGDRSILEIREREGYLSARVIALDDPVYRQGEEFGPVGAPRRDDRNPDASKRQRPLLGIELLQDYRFENGKWRGRIYDPESGNIYSSTMAVDSAGSLKMRGYIGIPMFGRTASFAPLPACSDGTTGTSTQSELLADLDVAACE